MSYRSIYSSSSIKSDNGYLSDILSQKSDNNYNNSYNNNSSYMNNNNNNNETDISLDLIESTKYIENQFKQRYNILKNAYENRIQQLSLTLEETFNEITTNELIDSLKEDSSTLVFIPNIIQDIFLTHLKSDREKYLIESLNKENELKLLLQNQQEICKNQNETIISLENEIERGRDTNDMMIKMREQISNLNEQYKQMSLQAQEEITNVQREKDAALLRESSLQQQLNLMNETLQEKTLELEKYRNEVNIKTKEVFELEKTMELTGKDIQYKEVNETRYKNEIERIIQKYQIIYDQKETFQKEIIELQDKVRLLTSELEKYKQTEVILQQENKKCKQSVTEIMKKVERLLEEEGANHEAVLESYKRKLVSLKEKYEMELQTEKNHSQQLEKELNELRNNLEEKNKEIKVHNNEIRSLKEEYSHEYHKQLTLRKRIEELISDSAKSKLEANEYENKFRKLEHQYNEMISQHNRELIMVRDQMRLETQQKLEKERQLMDRKSDIYRLKYENNFQEYLQQRNDPLFVVSRSDTYPYLPPPPPPPPLSSSIIQSSSSPSPPPPTTTTEYNYEYEIKSLKRNYEKEINLLKEHLEKAEITIERLKKMVLDGKDSIAHYKSIGEDLKNQLKQFNNQNRIINNRIEKNVSFDQSILQSNDNNNSQQQQQQQSIKNLENIIITLQQQLKECQEQALHDQEEDSKLLLEMQKKFDILMDKYETIRVERNSEISNKIEEINELKEIIKEYEFKIKQIEDENNQLKSQNMLDDEEREREENIQKEKQQDYNQKMREEINSLLKEKNNIEVSLKQQKDLNQDLLQRIQFRESQINELEDKYNKNKIEIEQLNEDKSKEKKNTLKEKNKTKLIKEQLHKISQKYEVEIDNLKRMILKLRSNVLILQSTLESEVDMIKNQWLYYGKKYRENIYQEFEEKFKKQLLDINEIHMQREYNSILQQNIPSSQSQLQSQLQLQSPTILSQKFNQNNKENIEIKRLLNTSDSMNLSQNNSFDSKITFNNHSNNNGNNSINNNNSNNNNSNNNNKSNILEFSSNLIEIVCNGYHNLLFNILDNLQSTNLLHEGNCRDIRYLITSLPTQILLYIKQLSINQQYNINLNISIESLGFSVVGAKLNDMFTRGIRGNIIEKEQLNDQISILSNELRIEKLKKEEFERELNKQNKEIILMNQSFHDDINMSRISTRDLNKSLLSTSSTSLSIHQLDSNLNTTFTNNNNSQNSKNSKNQNSMINPFNSNLSIGIGLENDEKQYLLLQIKHLNQQIHDLKLSHKNEIERIQTEFQMKENLYTEKIESLKRVSNEKQNDLISELENKLKTEQIRRQHLQTRLLAEESIHQKEINELETKCNEYKKNLERLQNELLKHK